MIRSCFGYLWRKENVDNTESGPSPALGIIRDLFKDFLEEYENLTQELNFPVLHQIVIGMTDIDLRAQLSVTTAQIDARCSQGRTPLMWATSRSNLNAIQLLLDFGASPYVTDFEHRNVFHIAAYNKSIKPLKLLLDIITAGPMPLNIEQEGLQIRLIDQPDIYGLSPLSLAIARKRTDHALHLLEYHCAIDTPSHRVSPLILAVENNENKILRYLLTKGARTDAVDRDQMGVLHIAGAIGDLETILTLLHHEAPLDVDVTHTDIYGCTPIRCFELHRKLYVQEDEQLLAKSREAFERLLNKVNSYRLQL